MKVNTSGSTVSPAIFIKRLAVGVLLINLFVVALQVVSLHRSRLQYEQHAAVTTRNLAQVLDYYVGGSIEKINIVLAAAAEEFGHQTDRGEIDKGELNAFLKRLDARVPELEGLQLTNDRGEIMYSAGSSTKEMTSVATTEYFKGLYDTQKSELFISKPTISRSTGKWVLVLGRRLSRPDGSFAGGVFGEMPLEQFTRLFSTIQVGKHGVVLLRDRDLGIIVRYPPPRGVGNIIGQKNLSRAFRDLLGKGLHSGTFEAVAPLDNVQRTYTYRKISGYPLYVFVGLATVDYLAEWRSDVGKMSVLTGIFFLVSLLMSWLAYRDWKRRKSLVRLLMRQEEKFRTIFNNSADAILIRDRDGNIIEANDVVCQRLGVSRAELLQMTIADIDSEEDPEVLHELLGKVYVQGQAVFERTHVARDGKRIPSEINARVIDFEGRELVLSIFRDITERKQAEEALLESERRYWRLFQDAALGIFQATLDGKFLIVNPACAQMFGYSSPEEFLTEVENAAEVHADRARREEVVRMALQSSGAVKVENKYRRKDGSFFVGDLVVRQVKGLDGSPTHFEGFIEDISDLKRAAEERQKLEAQLNQAQKMEAIGQLAGGVAHDFNNILTAIFGYSEIVLMRIDKDNPNRHHIEQIISSAGRGAELTSGLLAFSRKQVMHPQLLNLGEVVQGVESMLRRLVPEDIDFRTSIADEELTVTADKGQIEQVLVNLVTNAKDAMPRGGMLTIGVFPAAMDNGFIHAHGFGRPGKYACVSVADTGCGIDEETRKKIFDPFFTTKEVGKGTGLGLAIIYGIVKQHDGYITVESVQDGGTTLQVYLPLCIGTKAEAHSGEAEPLCCGTETILLAEDDETLRKLHKMVFKEAGYRVIESFDGRDALDRFMEQSAGIDILVTDLIMPRIDGKELYDEIMKVRPEMKALFMSGYAKDIITERGISDEEFNFMAKPVMPSSLLKKVRAILDNG